MPLFSLRDTARKLCACQNRGVNSDDKCLRAVGPDDEAEIHRLLCVPEVYQYLADGVEPPPSIASHLVQTAAVDFERHGGGLWALVASQDPKILGLVRLAGEGDGELELTYLLHPAVWGAGYATRMAHTAMHYAFGTGLASAIWAGADLPNTASLAVMQRLGMRFRRNVDYPAGPGVEYVIDAAAFDDERIERLPID